jgi:hypothetical protein
MNSEKFIIEIRQFEDLATENGKAWVVDLLDLRGDVIIEGAGVSSDLVSAIMEAGRDIAYYVAEEAEANA